MQFDPSLIVSKSTILRYVSKHYGYKKIKWKPNKFVKYDKWLNLFVIDRWFYLAEMR